MTCNCMLLYPSLKVRQGHLCRHIVTTISKMAGTSEEQELENVPTNLPLPDDDDPIERDLFVPIAVRCVTTRGQLSA